ncbi:hypothetical protein [uncultured Mameliella sp.]|uniref:hypothetical protein n=1 Tax=uncultured Mameliella sp. TaxID=1447087 RepID=UPI0026217312|nr:hypothetical protein [uncultured Mameliella sp.]
MPARNATIANETTLASLNDELYAHVMLGGTAEYPPIDRSPLTIWRLTSTESTRTFVVDGDRAHEIK